MNKLLSTYGLTHLPFSKDLQPAEMFRTEQFEEALQSMKAAIEGQTSAVVTGDSGSGKTCLIRALEEDLPAGRYRFHYNPNATVNRATSTDRSRSTWGWILTPLSQPFT